MIDSGAAWALHPAVSVRPEPFGALLYHFGNRKLSFLKDRTLLAVVEALADTPSLDAALDAGWFSVSKWLNIDGVPAEKSILF